MALKQGWEPIEATPLTLWFTQFKGENTCSQPLGRSWAWPCFLLGTRGSNYPPLHISSSVWLTAHSPPELETTLQRWEGSFQNIRIRPPCKGCLSTFPLDGTVLGTVPGWVFSLDYFSASSLLAGPTAFRADPQMCSPLIYHTCQKPGTDREAYGSWCAPWSPRLHHGLLPQTAT